MPAKPKKGLSLRDALLQALRTCPACAQQVTSRKCSSCGATLKPRPVKDVIESALQVWTSPAGKTPRATAATQLLNICRAGLATKPAKGMVVATFPKAAR